MRGVSIIELLIALAITLLVSALATRALVEAADAFAWQPAAGELTARARAVAQAITADLTAAGAGPRVLTGAAGVLVGTDTARLSAWLPPILPRVVALAGGDGDGIARTDRVSILTIADTAPQAAVRRRPPGWAFVPGPTCPALIDGCGLRPDMPLLLLEPWPGFQLTKAGAVDDSGLELLDAAAAGDDAVVAAVEVVSYRFDAGRGELLRGRAAGRGQPVADHVTVFDVELWGDGDPPAGPRWPASGDTCVTAADGAPRLPAWAPPGSPAVRLDVARLSDGPWCGVTPFRFDADLFRVRRVRVHVRFEAEPESARGRNPARVTRAGLATAAAREVDDLEVVVEVTPPALRGGP
jgi:hypothetical protein